jgi:GNAT superfamily N-acetyltransferase
MDNLILRLLGPENVMDAHAVWKEAGLTYHPAGRDSVSRMTQELRLGKTFLVGAFLGEALLGVALGTEDGRKGWINRLAVRPGYQKQGVAQALISFCEKQFKSRGLGIVAALIEEHNAASRELFQREGYEDRSDIHYFRKLTGGEDW